MKTKLLNLQAVRGLAAVAVMYHHSRMLFSDHSRDHIFSYIEGSIGVPVFFIISGFVMSFTTRHLTGSAFDNFKDFAIKRIIRILPLFYFAVALTLLANHATLKHNLTTGLGKTLSVLFFQPIFKTHHGQSFDFWILPTVWTLNYEMYFYGLFAISLFAGRFRYHILYGMLVFLILIVPLALTHEISIDTTTFYPYSINYLNFLTNPILLLFVSGLLLDHFLPKIKLRDNSVLTLFLVSLILFILHLRQLLPISPFNNVVVCTLFITSVILVDMRNLFTPPQWLIYLGNMSYSLYILHMVFYSYMPTMFAYKFPNLGLKDSWIQLVIINLVVFLFSAITYEVIEKRFTNYLKRKLLPKKLVKSVI